VIHNGFNIPKTKQVPRNERRSTLYDKLDAPTLLYISRYHPQKDPTLFCQTLSIVHQRFPELKCYAFGEGLNTHQPQWQRLLQEYSLAHIVSSMGVSDNLEPWMSSANALILTSAEESFPNVIGEAMALGTPIVSTSVGDIPHLCGELGFLSPAGDPDLLAKKCIEALSLSHVDRIQLAQKQQLRIQNLFNLERQHQTLEKLYLRKPSRQS
jgi:glycosyltransferase involved in cell wall biosynthesis